MCIYLKLQYCIFFLHQQSSDTDLATVMKAVVGHSSYPKKLTVKVLCSHPATTYIYDKKEKRELMNTVVADSSKVVKCVVYDAKKFHRFKAGTTIILRNIIRKPVGIAVTSATVIFPAPQTLNLPPYMEKEGMAILHLSRKPKCPSVGKSFRFVSKQ